LPLFPGHLTLSVIFFPSFRQAPSEQTRMSGDCSFRLAFPPHNSNNTKYRYNPTLRLFLPNVRDAADIAWLALP
jgi:hypothetical protein